MNNRVIRKRIFVVKASQAYVDRSMNSRALASYGRLDVIARSAIAALIARKGVRCDAAFYAVLEGQKPKPLVIGLDGERLSTVFTSEVEFGQLVRRALRGELKGEIELYETRFTDLVSTLLKRLGRKRAYYLHELGVDILQLKLEPHAMFILGDHTGMDTQTEEWLRRLGVTWVSLGPTPYFTEHCITFVHAVLDGHPIL